MPIRKSAAVWEGTLKNGKGKMELGSGAWKGSYSFSTRFEETPGTNPEELIGAAHAGCFSMQLSGVLEKAGFLPEHIRTIARVHIDKTGEGFTITGIELDTEGNVPGIDEKTFIKHAEVAKETCPVSVALKATSVTLRAKLVKSMAA